MTNFEVVDDLPCVRCGGESYVTVRVPHPGYLYPELQPERGMLVFTLCPRCDARNSRAHGLLAYFAYHSAVDADGLDDFVALMDEWMRSLLQPPKASRESFDEDEAAYRRGDFD